MVLLDEKAALGGHQMIASEPIAPDENLKVPKTQHSEKCS
jgi:hypothetical protein